MREPTLFVVDDENAICEALELLMTSVGLQVETFGSGAEFLRTHDPARSGCLLLDIRMPGMSGLELQRELGRRNARLPVIFLTGHGDVALAVQAMQGGAFHFFEKPFNDQELLDTIHLALKRDAGDRELNGQLEALRERAARLTPREREVMWLVVEGKANKVVAADLGISERTVEIHRARVMEKMVADSLAHLVRMGLQIVN